MPSNTQYSLTYQQLQNQAIHAIGGTPDANAPLAQIVSGAMEYLYNCHPWSWREAITTLSFTAGVGQIPLPADFGELIDLCGLQARYTAVRKAQWIDIARVRVYGLPDAFVCLYAVGAGGQYQVQNPTTGPTLTPITSASGQLVTGTYYVNQTWLGAGGGETAPGPEMAIQLEAPNNAIQVTPAATPSGAGLANIYVSGTSLIETFAGSVAGGSTLEIDALPAQGANPYPVANTTFDPSQVMQKVLELAPTPASNMVQAMYLTYRRLAPVMVNPTDVPAVPYNFFDLLKTLVRAMAVSSTEQQAGHDWQLFNQQLPLYKNADTMAQGEAGGVMIDALSYHDDGIYALRPWLSVKTAYDP